MGFKYNEFKHLLASAGINLATDQIRAMLVMTNTTADTEDDAEFIADLTTLDEYDGTNYARKIVPGLALVKDFANDRVLWDFTLITWSALGPGARDGAGMILFKLVNNDADSPLICYIDDAAIFPFTGNNNDFTIEPDVNGALEIV